MRPSVFLAFFLVLLSACRPNDTPTPTPQLFNESRDALDKAKALEGILQQQNATQRQSLDEQNK